MFVIGLTGGIASGKSTVTKLLADRGAAVIDADRLGHESYTVGTAPFRAIVAEFGSEVLAEDGSIDRAALGRQVFGNADAMHRLTDIVWPAIHGLAKDRIADLRRHSDTSFVVLEAAVLIEAGWQDLIDELWVVVTDPAIAVERLMERNGLNQGDAEARLRSQISNQARMTRADVIIENNGSLAVLERQVEEAWHNLRERLGRQQGLPA